MIKSGTTSVAESSIKIDANRLSWVWSHRRSRIWRELRSHSVSRLINASVLPDLGRRLFLNSSFSVSFRGLNLPVAKCCKLHFIRRIISFCFGKRCFRKYEFFSLKMSSDGRRKWVNELTISTQNLFQICVLCIPMQSTIVDLNRIIFQSKFFFLFVGRDPTTCAYK